MATNSSSKMPANEAWQQMQTLLDAEMPTNKHHNNGNNKKYSILLLLLLISGCGGYQLYQTYLHKQGNVEVASSKHAYDTKVSSGKPQAASEKLVPTNNQLNQQPLTKINKANTQTQTISVQPSSIAQNQNAQHTTSTDEPKAKLIAIKSKQTNVVLASSNRIKTSKIKAAASSLVSGSNKAQLVAQTAKQHLQTKATKATKTSINQHQQLSPIDDSIISISETHVDSKQNEVISLMDKATDTVKTKVDSNKTHIATANTPTKIIKNKKGLGLQVGLDFSFPVNSSKTTLTNAYLKTQPLELLIPTIWISKPISSKTSIAVYCNPYATYLLNNDALSQTKNFVAGATSATATDIQNSTANYQQKVLLNKLISTEIGVQLNYKVTPKLTTSFGLGYSLVRAAIFSNSTIKNGTEIMENTLFGAAKNDKEWNTIQHQIVMARIEATYSLKHIGFGGRLIQPLQPVLIQNNGFTAPINVQLFMRWKLF